MKNILIVGAGPAGLTAAKAVLEAGMTPVVVDKADEIGGIWRLKNGYVWPEMPTNISQWNNSFSDFPWPDSAPDFPNARQVNTYLKSYAYAFNLGRHIEIGMQVQNVEQKSDGLFTAEISNPHGTYVRKFDGAIVTTGILARPYVQPFFPSNTKHSSAYRRDDKWKGKHVGIFGGSLSGMEIASDIVEQGGIVTLFMSRPVWILSRLVRVGPNDKLVPSDLMNIRRRSSVGDPLQANLMAATSIEDRYGNPGDFNETLRVKVDTSPVYGAIVDDRFLSYVKQGLIVPVMSRVVAGGSEEIKTQDGRFWKFDSHIACTGFRADLSFLSRPIQRLLQYDADDGFMPFVADRAVRPLGLSNFYLVGQSRGPFWGGIELQARWAAAEMAKGSPAASEADVAAALALRNKPSHERPQFSHGAHVPIMDDLAAEIGVSPEKTGDPILDAAIDGGPVTPAQFRLNGPHSNFEIARRAVYSAVQRATP